MVAPLLNKHQLAEILGKPVTFVEENCAARRWEFTWVGREYRFTEAQVEQIIASLTVPAQSAPARRTRKAKVPANAAKAAPTPAAGVPQGNASRSRLYRPAGAS